MALREQTADGWAPLARPPADPAALWRYATAAPWAAPYALRLRRVGLIYAVVVALPVAAGGYSVAWLAQLAAGIAPDWLPDDTGGWWRRWLAAHPPALGDLLDRAGALPPARRPVGYGAVAVSAAAYGAVWMGARLGRLAAAALLLFVLVLS